MKKLREQEPETLKALRWLPDAVAVDLYARLHGEPLPSTRPAGPAPVDARRRHRDRGVASPSSRPGSTSR